MSARYPSHRILASAIAFNEEGKIGRVVGKVPRDVADEILVVDDGSTDGTAAEARAAGARVLSHAGRRGAGASIRSAIRRGREGGFHVLCVMAGNDKDRPGELPRLIDPIVKDGFDIVQGSRYRPGGAFGNLPPHRRLATRFVHPLLFSLCAGQRMTDTTNGFRAIRLSIFDDPRLRIAQPWLDGYELEPYLLYQAIRLGYRVREVGVTKIYPTRTGSYSKMRGLPDWWRIVRPLVLLGLGARR